MLKKFDPLKPDDTSVGEVCPLCNKILEIGQCISLVADSPANEEEEQKMKKGRAYTAIAKIVHWDCVAEKRINQLENAIRKHRDNFPDEALQEEYELWSVLE